MTSTIFTKLETDIMKILTRNSDLYLTQYQIYNNLVEDRMIKDPVEKEQLKIRFLVVLKVLSATFDNVSVIINNGIISAKFIVDEDSEEEYTHDVFDVKDPPAEKMPDDIEVVRFIVDEKLTEFYLREDYQGNTILHTLVVHSDLERIEEIMYHDNISFLSPNKDGMTPVDLISSFKISNMLIKKLIENNHISEMKLNRFKNFLDDLYFHEIKFSKI